MFCISRGFFPGNKQLFKGVFRSYHSLQNNWYAVVNVSTAWFRLANAVKPTQVRLLFYPCRYTEKATGDGMKANMRNPEVWVSVDTPNPLITKQNEELDKATKHLNNAQQGINVDWLNFDSKSMHILWTELFALCKW